MNYDFTKVKKICEENIANKIYESANGLNLPTNYFNIMVERISSIFKACPPEIIHAPFSVYVVKGFDMPKNTNVYYEKDLKNIVYKNASIIVLDKNRFTILHSDIDFNEKDVFSYTFKGKQNEYFKLNDDKIDIEDYIDPLMYSIFSCPTYADIDEALDIYYYEKARNSICYIINDSWYDPAKQKLKDKPEDYFQKSLFLFLSTYLRGYTVKREQIVDDSHLVDIKTTGPNLNTVSLIEIKWIGKSIKVRYSDARANDGAKQLIGYLDASESREPNVNFKGYLVVFDVRRKKDKKNYYDDIEIKYSQGYRENGKIELKRFFLCE